MCILDMMRFAVSVLLKPLLSKNKSEKYELFLCPPFSNAALHPSFSKVDAETSTSLFFPHRTWLSGIFGVIIVASN